MRITQVPVAVDPKNLTLNPKKKPKPSWIGILRKLEVPPGTLKSQKEFSWVLYEQKLQQNS